MSTNATGGSYSPKPSGPTAAYTLALIISLFFLWGVANNLNDILIKQFKKAFELSDFRAGLVQSAFYIGYFLMAIPASLVTRRYGYKAALVAGLGLYAAGAFAFYPASELRAYPLFLSALFVIACGLAFLETSANPLITVLGPAEDSERRLNLAQSFNPLGSIVGILIGKYFIFSGVELAPEQLSALDDGARVAYQVSQSQAVQRPYVVLAVVVLVWAVLIALAPLPADRVLSRGFRRASPSPARTLARNPNFQLAVVAQFFYVGAQVGIWSYLIRYAQQAVPGLPERRAADFLTISLLLFMGSRFAATALMRWVDPARLLAVFAFIAFCTVMLALLLPGRVGVTSLIATSAFMSIMFPTIFALGLRGLEDEVRKAASSLLVMAIIGGAALTVLMGAISDAGGIHRAMLVPMASFAVVLCFACYTLKLRAAT